jgi:hypothetical protein
VFHRALPGPGRCCLRMALMVWAPVRAAVAFLVLLSGCFAVSPGSAARLHVLSSILYWVAATNLVIAVQRATQSDVCDGAGNEEWQLARGLARASEGEEQDRHEARRGEQMTPRSHPFAIRTGRCSLPSVAAS